MSDILVPLSEDEITVLTIAAQDQNMMAIGRWEKPTERLLSLGYLSGDRINARITALGRKALDQDQDEYIGRAISLAGQIGQIQHSIQGAIEQAAKELAEISRQSALATHDRPSNAARQWGKVMIDRAVEILETGYD